MDSALRSQLYDSYSSTHAGVASQAAGRLAFRRDILPHLPLDNRSEIVDLGCGQGELIRQLLLHGYTNVRGIDLSVEQVQLAHAAGLTQVELGDYRESFGVTEIDAVTATDFLEHLTKSQVFEVLGRVHGTLRAGGVFIIRVPNAVSPFSGNYRYGDITHETSFTASSLRQLGAAAGFSSVSVHACPPPVHGFKSLARNALWKVASSAMKITLATETGVLRGHLVTQNVVAVMRKAVQGSE